jgi:XRE family aerobic/anaerobic benzoate catabolism transcriptional regulator
MTEPRDALCGTAAISLQGPQYPRLLYALRRSTTTVWLRARPEDHWNRVVRQGDRRPMADHPQAMADLRALLAAREPLYAQAAVTVDTSILPAEHVVRAIVAQLS